MNKINIKIPKPQKTEYYVPIKIENGKSLYFIGCTTYGKDTDGVLRVSKAKWNEEFYSGHAYGSYEYAKRILEGILKYDKNKDAEYKMATVTVTTKTKVEFNDNE